MAQKVQVVDIGSYSAKLVTVRVPFIGFTVSSARESVYGSALEPKTRRSEQQKAVQELLPGKRLSGDSITVVMPAEKTLNRFLELPFSDRARIESVLAFELENHVPLSASEFLHDYIIVEKSKDGARLFVSLVPEKEIDELRELFASFDIDPRVVIHQAVANARLAELTPEPPSRRAAFIDIGHRKTVVTIVEEGEFAGCRIILHGGYDLTRALADRFSISTGEAESEKHAAHLFPAGEGLAVGRVQETANCLTDTLKSLIRDLRQSFRAQGDVDEIFLFGGGAKLQGLDDCISSTLGKPVTLLFPSVLKINCGPDQDGLENVSAIAAGFAGQKGPDAQRVNFRQGDFFYEGDFKYVRGRLVYLAVVAILLLAAFAAPQVMKYRSLVAQGETLRKELAQLSLKILGEDLEDWEEIMDLLDEMPPAEVWTVFPDLTAHEVYWEIADMIARIDGQPTGETAPEPEADKPGEGEQNPANPDEGKSAERNQPGAGPPESPLPGGAALTPEGEGEKAKPEAAVVTHHLDMNDIRIDGASRTAIGEGVVEFTGNASSVATMELFLSTVGQHPCFHNIQRTKQEKLKATAGKEGWWRFRVEFTVSCPKKSAETLKKERDQEEKGEEPKAETPGEQLPPGQPGSAPAAAPDAGRPGKEAPAGAPEKAVEPSDKPRDPNRPPVSKKRGEDRRKEIERKARGVREERGRPEEGKAGPATEAGREAPERVPERAGAMGGSIPTNLRDGARLLNKPVRRDVHGTQPILPSIPHKRLFHPAREEQHGD